MRFVLKSSNISLQLLYAGKDCHDDTEFLHGHLLQRNFNENYLAFKSELARKSVIARHYEERIRFKIV
jgi:hypothetical protein